MRDNLTVYKIWAPDDALWTAWAKPVLFAEMQYFKSSLDIPEISWSSELNKNTPVIIDLPGGEGIAESLSLAKLGYRPVPLYNGVQCPGNCSTIVNVSDIISALYSGADVLETLHIKPDAPPVFMLDSNRMNGFGKQPGKYDNRWCVFPQDMPSAKFLINHGVKQIIVRTSTVQNDLSHILCRYQEQGIRVFQYNGLDPIKKILVTQPTHFKSLIYRFKMMLGLTRNAAGGFGGRIPEPTQHSSGMRHYGMG